MWDSLRNGIAWLLNKEVLEGVQAFVTIIAILVGAVWFLRTRRRYPRANFELSVTHRHMDSSGIYVRIIVKVKNQGEVLLSINQAKVRIIQVVPYAVDIAEAVMQGLEPPRINERQIKFPILRTFDIPPGQANIIVEPGEQHELTFDLFVSSENKTLLIAVFVESSKLRKIGWWRPVRYFTDKDNRFIPVGWETTSLYDLV